MKKTSWVAPSFDGFGLDTTSNSQLSKRYTNNQKTASSKRQSNKNNSATHSSQNKSCHVNTSGNNNIYREVDVWVDIHKPQTLLDLAVHKKKVADVQTWINDAFNPRHTKGQMLLLTGPAGAGKTATLHVLAKEMEFELQEYSTPITPKTTYQAFESDFRPIGGYISESATAHFQDFILRANKYPTLEILSSHPQNRKLILIEDFPNVFFRDTTVFHNILRQYYHHGHSPVVFIVSDSSAGESNERFLFPKELQADISIANISFNPVAQTSMIKVLQKIVNIETSQDSITWQAQNKMAIENIAVASSGDIRGAINALQFSCLQVNELSYRNVGPAAKSMDTTRKRGGRVKKSKKQVECTDLAAIGGRDTSLFLFRALGKVLYCKRGDLVDFPNHSTLPCHLSHHCRDPLLVNPEDVVERVHLSGDFFTSFLHQNYVDFFCDIDDLVRATEYISDTDYLTSQWTSRQTQGLYAASVAARGLMHSNRTTRSSSTTTAGSKRKASATSTAGSSMGWRPLHKPQWFATSRKMRENIASVKRLFRGQCLTPEDLQTQRVPYINVIGPTAMNTLTHAQADIVRSISRFADSNKYGLRAFSETLDEKDMTVMKYDDNEDTARDNSIGSDMTQSKNMSSNDSVLPNMASIDGYTHTDVNKRVDDDIDEETIIDDFDD